MSSEERAAVKAYVPRWQKERWVEEAEGLDMSQSEFLRAMVQAGRRNINIEPEEGSSETVEPRGQTEETGFESRVRSCLESEGTLDWDELLDAVTDGVEDQVDDAIRELENRGEVRYAPREGGYTLVDDE